MRVIEGSTPSYKPHLLARLSVAPLCGAVLTGGTESSTQDFHPQKDFALSAEMQYLKYLVYALFHIYVWIILQFQLEKEFTYEKNFKTFSIFL